MVPIGAKYKPDAAKIDFRRVLPRIRSIDRRRLAAYQIRQLEGKAMNKGGR
tara:strand:- start:722 stop:874 length:153 start_codon:yes stop_codon:yes gene_type:complete